MTRGSANADGDWWGRRADDWSRFQEATAMPLYRAALARLSVGGETRLLDVACGAGLFCEMAAQSGASVEGIDASAPLVEIARRRVPEGRFFVGDMGTLPFATSSFDVVTGFNAFQYAAEPPRALAEASRVVRPGGAVLVAVWGDPEDCEALSYVSAVGALMPPSAPGSPGPLALTSPEALRAAARKAGLTPRDIGEVDMPFVYADLETALRGILSAGPAACAIDFSGEERVRAALVQVLAPFRLSSGRYRLENRFRYLIAGP
jgi:SAM-dependent methyltransferase